MQVLKKWSLSSTDEEPRRPAHQKLLLKRNIASSKNSRYHNVPKVNTEMINMNQITLLSKEVQFSHLIQQIELKPIRPWVKNLYFTKI